jgi:hypothetical protein
MLWSWQGVTELAWSWLRDARSGGDAVCECGVMGVKGRVACVGW